MSIFFAKITGRPAFFDSAIHGDAIPAEALEISAARHAELLAAQAAGAEIYAGKDGKPRFRSPRIDPAERRANLQLQIKREAQRRIRLVSPEWRQLNDLRQPSDDGARRFAMIDTIRAAATTIETLLEECPAGKLDGFDCLANPAWPEIN